MKIGELAERAGCDVQTVRFYEREQLLEAPHREASGYRRYADRHLAQLQFIRHCRSLDIPLPEIRQLLEFAAAPEESCAQVDALLDDHIAQVQRRLKALRALEKQLLGLRARCNGDASRSCAILESFMCASATHGDACSTRA
jgi:Cd(II)/Pb(II)-responsive transcriptional regulator